MRLSIVIAALLQVGTAAAQVNEGPRMGVVDFHVTTENFAKIFKDICFEFRKNPEHIRTLAPGFGWEEMPGPFPYHEEGSSSTTLVSWAFWSKGVPYKVHLMLDASLPGSIGCKVLSPYIKKSTLVEVVTKVVALRIRRQLDEGDTIDVRTHDMILIESESDEKLRVICTMPKVANFDYGECLIVHVDK